MKKLLLNKELIEIVTNIKSELHAIIKQNSEFKLAEFLTILGGFWKLMADLTISRLLI